MEMELIWYCQDIIRLDETLSKDEACEVLDKIKLEYDEEIGVDRSVIADAIEHYKHMQKYDRK